MCANRDFITLCEFEYLKSNPDSNETKITNTKHRTKMCTIYFDKKYKLIVP